MHHNQQNMKSRFHHLHKLNHHNLIHLYQMHPHTLDQQGNQNHHPHHYLHHHHIPLHQVHLHQQRCYIQNLLEKQGIDPTIILTTSHGEGNPLVLTADNVSEPRNRRVEVIVR